MTCIAGLVHDGQVWLASDGQESWGWTKHDCGCKIERHGELAVGFSGPARVSAAFKDRFVLPELPEDQSKHDRWLRVSVPDAIKQCLTDAGVVTTKDGVHDYGIKGIMAWGGRMCVLDENLTCYQQECEYASVGSGYTVALGSLFSTVGKEPEERLRIAINAANTWVDGCGCGVHVVKVGGH